MAFADTMVEIGTIDPKLVVLVGDISHGILQPFAQSCPGRYYNIGILENTIVSMSAGLSRSGLCPVAHTIAPFLIERSFEQIKLEYGYQEIGGNLITVGSAFDYSGLGCSHHCYNDINLMKSLPGSQVLYPAMPNEFNILFKQTYNNNQLTYFRLPGDMHEISISDSKIVLGKGIRIIEGDDASILVIGPQLKVAMEASRELSIRGINIDLLYYPTIKPFDEDLLKTSIKKTKRILIIEEHSVYGGVNEDVLRTCCNRGDIKYDFINIPDVFLRNYGNYHEHCEFLGFTKENIVNKILNIIQL
jgi:transketolase